MYIMAYKVFLFSLSHLITTLFYVSFTILDYVLFINLSNLLQYLKLETC